MNEVIERPRTVVLTVTVASFAFALIQLDVTVVNVALPRIGTDLGTRVAGLQWVVDGYALPFAVLLLSGGVLGDRFGAKKVYLAGIALFAAASAACGFAGSMGTLVVARAAQGVGAAAMLPTSLALLNHACAHDAKLRAAAVGWWTAAGSIAIAAGPIVGGVILGLGSWRNVFLINLPVCALGLLLTWRVPETGRRPGAPRSFDLRGQILAALALAGLVGAVIEARPLGPAHPLVLGGGALFLVCGALFVAAERRSAAPLLPLHLFASPAFGVAISYGVIANLTYYGTVFVLSLYLQRVLGYGATEAGLAFLPLTATFLLVNVLSGWLTGRFGSRWPMVVGALVDAGGFALLLGLGSQSIYAAMLLPFALIPAGMGTGVPAMTVLVLSSVDRFSAGVASAALNAARQAAGALGIAIFGALSGDRPDEIVHGLHAGAILSIVLLLSVGALAGWGARPPANEP